MKKLILALAFLLTSIPAMAQEKAKESTYERVMKTQTIRCGYIVYAPTIIIDPNTRQISGIMHDIVEQAAKSMNLKVEWTEELNYSNMIEALQTNRIDMVCANVWNYPGRAPYVAFNTPLFYSGIGVWVREGDHRFDHDLSLINDASVRISVIDGDNAQILTTERFPKAKIVGMPQSSDWTQFMVGIAQNKADVTFHEAWLGADYLAKNPGTIRNLARDKPIQIFSNSTMIKGGEERFKTMIDTVYQSLLEQGVIDAILDQYEKYPGTLYRIAKPYETIK